MAARSRAEIARIRNSEPQDHPTRVDPDNTYDESTNPSNGWRTLNSDDDEVISESMPAYAAEQQATSETYSHMSLDARFSLVQTLLAPSDPSHDSLQVVRQLMVDPRVKEYVRATANQYILSELGYYEQREDTPVDALYKATSNRALYPLTSYGQQYYARKSLQREGRRYYSQEELTARAERLAADAMAPELDTHSFNFEPVKSGSAPQLPYPALRVSTTSGAIYPNAALKAQLALEFNGHLPNWCLASVDTTNMAIGLKFTDQYQHGAYTLSLGGDYAGPAVHCGALIQKLVYAAAGNKFGYRPEELEAGRDRVFGRRRAYRLPDGTWVIRLADPIV